MDKSPEAFRTISEVADFLETPAHVLRFWESRFPQIRPVKRAGGRRYYRPADVALLTGIKYLLHAEGLTIRGVQKVLREQGVRHVASLIGQGDLLDFELDAEIALEQALAANFDIVVAKPIPAESATIFALETALARKRPDPHPAPEQNETPFLFDFAEWDSPQLPAPPLDPIRTLQALPAGVLADSDAALTVLARANALLERMLVA
jgi:DNA-binding transcriptional MerR regulator